MTEKVHWVAGGCGLVFDCATDAAPRISGMIVHGRQFDIAKPVPLIEVVTVGSGHVLASGRLVHTAAGAAARYTDHLTKKTGSGETFSVAATLGTVGLAGCVDIERPDGVNAFRFRVTVTNTSGQPVVLRSVASVSCAFVLAGGDVADWDRLTGDSDWLGEGRWRRASLGGSEFPDLAQELTRHDPRGGWTQASTGTWSTGRHLPIGVLENGAAGIAVAWQIEHNGPWRAEIGEDTGGGYLALSGPTETDAAWTKILQPNESFTTVPGTLALGADFTDAIAELTRFRRWARRPHPDNAAMPVVFNDYMNTLNGDPTAAKLLPLVEAAADVGAEVFCIDAGWYDNDGDWWDSVGEWQPSTVRFPSGLTEVMEAIRDAGMTAGLWLEPEVVGVRSSVAQLLPDAAFLSRFGQRVVEHGRYHLDLRHPAARAHLDEAVDRLVRDLGVGYFKFDYNIDPGAGTDYDADSLGDGLLGHCRAYVSWLDGVLDRYPALIVEACSSGAMRADPAILQHVALQSTSDQQDFLKYPPIAAAAPLSYVPEQAASWAYPQPDMTDDEVVFSLVTGLLGRFYVSGYLNRMAPAQRSIVRDAITVARSIRTSIARSTPHWPLGLPGWTDPDIALGLGTPGCDLVSIWHRASDSSAIPLALPHLKGRALNVAGLFPSHQAVWPWEWDPSAAILTVTPKTAPTACTLRLTY